MDELFKFFAYVLMLVAMTGEAGFRFVDLLVKYQALLLIIAGLVALIEIPLILSLRKVQR